MATSTGSDGQSESDSTSGQVVSEVKLSDDGSPLWHKSYEGRVIRLETGFENIVKAQASLETEVHQLGDRIDRSLQRLSDDLSQRQKPQWSLLIMAASLVTTIVALVGAAGIGYTNISISKVADQTNAKFAEVETQFRGTDHEMSTNIEHNKGMNASQDEEIKRIRARVDELFDRTSRAAQKLQDHDIYLWPPINAIINRPAYKNAPVDSNP